MTCSERIKDLNEVLDYWKIINTEFEQGFFLKEFLYERDARKHNFMQTITHFSQGLNSMEYSMNSTQTTFSKC